MRPLHLASLPGFMLIRTCSPFWFDLASTEYPQRLAPHCSIRTLPSFSSVNHTPSGEVDEAGAVCFWAGVAVATTGAGAAGLAAGAGSCWACGADAPAAGGGAVAGG